MYKLRILSTKPVVERDTQCFKCVSVPKNTTHWPQPGLKPALLKSSTLTKRLPHVPFPHSPYKGKLLIFSTKVLIYNLVLDRPNLKAISTSDLKTQVWKSIAPMLEEWCCCKKSKNDKYMQCTSSKEKTMIINMFQQIHNFLVNFY